MTMTDSARQDIDELIRRLETAQYPPAHIREAGELLASAMPKEETFSMALGFWDSDHAQVRALGLRMMEAIAPAHEGARGFLAGAKRAPAPAGKPDAPDYSAIGEVIKLWMREHRRQRKGGR